MHAAYTYARGGFQIDAIDRMLGDGLTDSLMHLQGRAKIYWPSYKRSLAGLIKRLRAAEISVEAFPSGPRGGLRWHIL